MAVAPARSAPGSCETGSGADGEGQACDDRERRRALVQGSIGLVTALAPTLGDEASSRVAQRALKENRAVADLVPEEALLTEAQLNQLLELAAMTHPTRRQKEGNSA